MTRNPEGDRGIINKARTQTAVFWRYLGSDGYGGHRYDMPIEIDCRWDQKKEETFTDEGQEVVSKGEVMVDRHVPEGSHLMLGELSDIDPFVDKSDPNNVDNTHRVISFARIPDIGNISSYKVVRVV